jgi:hypothetical protein
MPREIGLAELEDMRSVQPFTAWRHRGEGGHVDSVRHDVGTEAAARAVAAGAEATGLGIVLWEETPIAYLPSKALRMRARSAGPLAHRR